MTPETLRGLIARGLNLTEAESVLDSLEHLTRRELFELCHAVGVECIRRYDSRAYLSRRLFLTLTVRVRSVERNEV